MITIDIKDIPAIFGLLNYHDVDAASRTFNKIIMGTPEPTEIQEQQSIDDIMATEPQPEVNEPIGTTEDTSLMDAFDDICDESPTTVTSAVVPVVVPTVPTVPIVPTIIQSDNPTATPTLNDLGAERSIVHSFEQAKPDPKNKGIAKIAPRAFDHFRKHGVEIIARKQYYSIEATTANNNKYELVGTVDAMTNCQIVFIRTRLGDIKTANANYETIHVRMMMRIIDNPIYKKCAVVFQHNQAGDFKYANVKNMASSVKKDTEKLEAIIDKLADITDDSEASAAYAQGSVAQRINLLKAVGLI